MLAGRGGHEAVRLATHGVVCGPREVDPAIRSADEWCAWARGPNKERLDTRGTSPQDALQTLALRLKELDA